MENRPRCVVYCECMSVSLCITLASAIKYCKLGIEEMRCLGQIIKARPYVYRPIYPVQRGIRSYIRRPDACLRSRSPPPLAIIASKDDHMHDGRLSTVSLTHCMCTMDMCLQVSSGNPLCRCMFTNASVQICTYL